MSQNYQEMVKKDSKRHFQNIFNMEANKDPLGIRIDSETKIKTEMCRNWETGNCEYGDKCFFAHGLKELRDKSNLKTLKLQKCDSFFKFGYCINGNKCQFRHTEDSDPQPNPLISNKRSTIQISQEKYNPPLFIDLESRNLYRS